VKPTGGTLLDLQAFFLASDFLCLSKRISSCTPAAELKPFGSQPSWVTMQEYRSSSLTKLQIGRYVEYFVKIAFTLHGFDLYSAEVDDKGISLYARVKNGIMTFK
jgi:hypothetical protein